MPYYKLFICILACSLLMSCGAGSGRAESSDDTAEQQHGSAEGGADDRESTAEADDPNTTEEVIETSEPL